MSMPQQPSKAPTLRVREPELDAAAIARRRRQLVVDRVMGNSPPPPPPAQAEPVHEPDSSLNTEEIQQIMEKMMKNAEAQGKAQARQFLRKLPTMAEDAKAEEQARKLKERAARKFEAENAYNEMLRATRMW